MKEYNIDIFGLAETNLAWTKALEYTAKYHRCKVFKQFSMVICSSNDPTSTAHQPGGVCLGVTGSTIGRIL
eukprot:8443162-Ditylum_brightwellii.AAC.1